MTRIQCLRHSAVKSLPLLLAVTPTIHSRPYSRGIALSQMVEPHFIRAYDPNNPADTCYGILSNSDINGDGTVDRDEYMSFVGQLSGGEIEVTNYIDLPFVIKVTFVYLSCLCMNSPENQMMRSECCKGSDAGISVLGAGPGETPTSEEDEYLTTVCSETQGAIDFERDETVTTSPTAVTQQTIRPTTSSPTQSPSADPIESPTNPPVLMTPTSNPSTKPTALPTSLASTVIPTFSPTTLEPSTNQPTVMPSITPTAMPPKTSPSAKPTTLPPSLLPTVTPMDLTTKPPTTMPPIALTEQPSAESLISVTVSPTSILLPTSPQVLTTLVPTKMDPTVVPVPTAPSTISQNPSLSSQPSIHPSAIEGEPAISSSTNPDSTKAPDGDLDSGDARSESLSAGGIAGIVVASVLVAYVALYAYATKKRKRGGDNPDLSDVRNRDLDDLEAGTVGEKKVHKRRDQGNKEDNGGEDTIGEGKARGGISNSPGEKSSSSDTPGSDDATDYIPQSIDSVPLSPPASSAILISGVPFSPKQVAAKSSSDDSSSCGESGWSSSAGLSSLNTASFDAGTDDGLLPGSPDRRLVSGAGVAAPVAGPWNATPTSIPANDDSDGSSEVSYDGNPLINDLLAIPSSDVPPQALKPVQGKVTRDDLNAAIEAGDWAVVGATAALLADTDRSSVEHMVMSECEHGEQSYHSRESSFSESSDSNRRTKELDRMVEDGDWEGVVLAAAQFDGTSSLDGQDDKSISSRSFRDVSPSSSKEKHEFRAEIERLVRRVVPDEVDNIDEMMLQFKGREDELVETLRTMQERSLAQRARAAVQKTAKLEAKAKTSLSRAKSRGGSISSASEPSHYGSSASGSGASSRDASLGDSNIESSVRSKKANQSSLELAIERGDWRAVGEAAAILGSGFIAPDESGDSVSSTSETLSNSHDKVHYLDALIAKGDWAGIVHAAATYQAMDDHGVGGSLSTEEEREALAQANMWQEIARQSKTDSSAEVTKGAVDAADWAISLAHKRIEDDYESMISYIGVVDEMDAIDAQDDENKSV